MSSGNPTIYGAVADESFVLLIPKDRPTGRNINNRTKIGQTIAPLPRSRSAARRRAHHTGIGDPLRAAKRCWSTERTNSGAPPLKSAEIGQDRRRQLGCRPTLLTRRAQHDEINVTEIR